MHADSSEAAAAAFWGSQSLRDSVAHAKTAFCIHNLAYQGFMPLATFPRLCLPDDALPPLLWPPLGVEGAESVHSSVLMTNFHIKLAVLTERALFTSCPLETCTTLHGPMSGCCDPHTHDLGS